MFCIYAHSRINPWGETHASEAYRPSLENSQPSLALTQIVAVSGDFPSEGFVSGMTLASIRTFAGTFAPSGSELADDGLRDISSSTALFLLLGVNFGGDGMNTFARPDLRGRELVGAGAATPPGQAYGSASITLTSDQVFDAPQAFAALGPNATATKQVTAVLDADATISDANLDALAAGASLSIARQGGADAQDVFGGFRDGVIARFAAICADTLLARELAERGVITSLVHRSGKNLIYRC